jgi:hypothetical protein
VTQPLSATAGVPSGAPAVLSAGVASVADNLALFHGVWLDLVTAYRPDGTPMTVDVPHPSGAAPAAFPYQQLVYLDFDAEAGRLTQTNVPLPGPAGSPARRARTFRAGITDGVLRFDPSGLEEPGTIGVSGGPGVLVLLPERVDTDAHRRFADPDYVRHLGGDQRTRTTTLYRDGELLRILTVSGTRIHTDPTRRVLSDPRGPEGPVAVPEENP